MLGSSYVRQYGIDDILIVFYNLQPNYVCDRIFDPTDTDEDNPLGKWRRELVELQPGDRFHIQSLRVRKRIIQYWFSLVSLLVVVHNMA